MVPPKILRPMSGNNQIRTNLQNSRNNLKNSISSGGGNNQIVENNPTQFNIEKSPLACTSLNR